MPPPSPPKKKAKTITGGKHYISRKDRSIAWLQNYD